MSTYVISDEYVAALPPIYKSIFIAWHLVDPYGALVFTPEEVVSGFVYQNIQNIKRAFDSMAVAGVLEASPTGSHFRLTELGLAIVTAVSKAKLDTVPKFVPPTAANLTKA